MAVAFAFLVSTIGGTLVQVYIVDPLLSMERTS
jgi:hypothetical protein